MEINEDEFYIRDGDKKALKNVANVCRFKVLMEVTNNFVCRCDFKDYSVVKMPGTNGLS